METLAVIYVALGVFIIAGATFWAGLYEENAGDVIGGAIFVACGWPIILAILIVISPFVGIYYLGSALRKRKS